MQLTLQHNSTVYTALITTIGTINPSMHNLAVPAYWQTSWTTSVDYNLHQILAGMVEEAYCAGVATLFSIALFEYRVNTALHQSNGHSSLFRIFLQSIHNKSIQSLPVAFHNSMGISPHQVTFCSECDGCPTRLPLSGVEAPCPMWVSCLHPHPGPLAFTALHNTEPSEPR